ncbi:MAG: hypothetical protein AAGE84_30990 [Cyanobacteria bacterium P01_G01_bin.39]
MAIHSGRTQPRQYFMSTKITVAYGDNFHLYREGFDQDYIYLEMEGVQFEASYNQVMVPIPIHIWEVIRQYPGIDLSWASRTDDEILRHVEQEVDQRIHKYQQADDAKHQRLIALLGAILMVMLIRLVNSSSIKELPIFIG